MKDKHTVVNILQAIREGDLEKTTLLLGNNPEYLNESTPFGTWLHVAATKNQFMILKLLIEVGY